MKSYLMIAVLTVAVANVSYSCQCLEKIAEGKPNFGMEYEKAQLIGIGQIVEVDRDVYPHRYLFEPRKVYKGTADQRIELFSKSGLECGYDFALGAEYIVYASVDENNHLSVGACSRTGKASESADYGLLENMGTEKESDWNESTTNYIQYKTGHPVDLQNPYEIIYYNGKNISLDQLIKLHPQLIKIEVRSFMRSSYLKRLNPPNRDKAIKGILVAYGISEERPKTQKIIKHLNRG
ncbi:MAG: hypothetical protein AAFV95_02825 [Bacteroidota bacterium]